jgi:hypothetical protein
VTHRWGSLTAPRRQSAPHLARLSPRPRGALFGGCGEGEEPHASAPHGTDAWGSSGAQSRRLGCGRHLTAAVAAAVGTPGGRIAPPGLSPTARICGGPAGGAPVTALASSGRPAFFVCPAAPGGDVDQHVCVYNSCARALVSPPSSLSSTSVLVVVDEVVWRACGEILSTCTFLCTQKTPEFHLFPALRPAPVARAPPVSTQVAPPPPGACAHVRRQVQHPGPAHPRRGHPRACREKVHAGTGIYNI